MNAPNTEVWMCNAQKLLARTWPAAHLDPYVKRIRDEAVEIVVPVSAAGCDRQVGVVFTKRENTGDAVCSQAVEQARRER